MSSTINLGSIRAANKHIFQLKSYDPYPAIGPTNYSCAGENLWSPFTSYNLGDWVVYSPQNFNFNGGWNALSNIPKLSNGQFLNTNTMYIVNVPGKQNLGAGPVNFQLGDLVVYNGSTWSRIQGSGISYICTTAHQSTATFTASYWRQNQLPPYFNLDNQSGVFYSNLPYLPIYSNTYNFTIRIDKQDVLHAISSYINQDFSLTIKGSIDNTIAFTSPQNLGNLNLGYLSEIAVQASHSSGNLSIRYNITGGSLPPGLTMGLDGSIIGRVLYGSALGQYNFVVTATDQYQQSISKDFYIEVTAYDTSLYTQIYAQPFLGLNTRYNYSSFINDFSIFNPALIYRISDPNFGIQQNIKLYLEYGIQQDTLLQYAYVMSQCFYKKQLFFGDIMIGQGNDDYGNHVYDVIYAQIIDPLENASGYFLSAVDIGNIVTYPNSIANMRKAFESDQIGNNLANTDFYQLPRWMRTIQDSRGVPPGYTLAVPLCYTLPGSGSMILNNINSSNFDFTNINFQIDRLIVNDNLTTTGTNYLIFASTTSSNINIENGPSLILTSSVLGVSGDLLTEDGTPLFS